MTFYDIAEAQGWNQDSQFNIICGFLERTEQWEAVMLHAQEVADCENYGEIPARLHSLIKSHNVSPADFQTMEADGLSHEQMEDAIVRFSVNGMFQVLQFLMAPASLYW